MRRACEWIWNLIGGAALHTLTMLLGFLFLLFIGGKGPESIFHLVFGIWIPFFISGAILADRKTRFIASIAILSSLWQLLFHPWQLPGTGTGMDLKSETITSGL